MADSTFDIVSKVDPMEVDNAYNQATKEIEQRYDFKGVGASIEFSGEKILMKANSEERVKAVLDVFQSKLIKRGISLKSLDSGEPFASGKEYRIEATLKEGIEQKEAKKIELRKSVKDINCTNESQFDKVLEKIKDVDGYIRLLNGLVYTESSWELF